MSTTNNPLGRWLSTCQSCAKEAQGTAQRTNQYLASKNHDLRQLLAGGTVRCVTLLSLWQGSSLRALQIGCSAAEQNQRSCHARLSRPFSGLSQCILPSFQLSPFCFCFYFAWHENSCGWRESAGLSPAPAASTHPAGRLPLHSEEQSSRVRTAPSNPLLATHCDQILNNWPDKCQINL